MTTVGYGGLSQLIFAPQHFKGDSPFNYFRAIPTYQLPATLALESVPDLMHMNAMAISKGERVSVGPDGKHTLEELRRSAQQCIVDMNVDAVELVESLVPSKQAPTHTPEMPLFEAFEQ